MAQTFHTHLHIDVPAEQITAAIASFHEWMDWMPGLVDVRPVGDEPFGVGTEWVETRRMFGKEASETFEVTAYEPGRHLALYVDGTKGSSKRGEYRFTYDLSPSGTGTDVAFSGTINMPGFMFKMLGRLLLASFHKACDRDLESLKRYLEQVED